MLNVTNKINCNMEIFHVMRWCRGTNPQSPPDIVSQSNPHPGDPLSLSWINLVRKGIDCSVSSTNKDLFPTEYIKPLSLEGSTFCYIKIKYRFNTILLFFQTQIIPPPIFSFCVCNIYFLHSVFL